MAFEDLTTYFETSPCDKHDDRKNKCEISDIGTEECCKSILRNSFDGCIDRDKGFWKDSNHRNHKKPNYIA